MFNRTTEQEVFIKNICDTSEAAEELVQLEMCEGRHGWMMVG